MNMNSGKYFKIKYIYLLSIICCVYYTYLFKVDTPFDTHTYIEAWSSLLEGHLDKWRTPVYPVFLGLMRTICGDNYMYYVVVIQHLVFLVSIKYFYLLIRYSITNKGISFFLTLFYALYPCVATYNCCIETSTFAVTGSVFLLYSIVCLYKTDNCRYGIYVFLWLIFLIFLRPAVMYLLPVTLIGWCLVAIKRKNFSNKPVVYGMAGSIVVSILLVVYIAMFKVNYGVFTPSGVGLINQYTIAKAANIIDLNSTGEELGFYQEAEKYINIIGMKAFSDSLTHSIHQNKGKYVTRLWQNVRKASEDNLLEPSWPVGIIGIISDFMGPKIKIIYYLFLIYAIMLLQWMIRKKKIAFIPCLLFMIGLSNYIVIVIGSPGEYGRLSLPAIPAYFVMFGQLLNIIRVKRFSDNLFI